MTSRDVRDIMQLGAAPAPSTSKPITSQAKAKRPEGITRELFALIGDNAPSLALAQPSKPKFKERIKRAGPSNQWTWTEFTNPSRKPKEGTAEAEDKVAVARGKLKLSHWVRDRPADYDAEKNDYRFTAFNTNSGVFSYTPEEYDAHLKEEGWSKEETDHLFELAHAYDLRFVVIADRWEFASERSIEDLKARYYSVCRRLIRNRPANDEPSKQQKLQSYNFDKNREVDRKAYLRSLLSRTPQQIAEEEFLYVESRRLEQAYSRISREREDLLRILGGREGIGTHGGIQVGVGGGAGGGGDKGRASAAPAAANAAAEKKNKKAGWDYEGLNGGGLPEGWQGEGSKRKATAAQDAANCIDRHPAPSVSAPKASQYPSVSLRSSRISAPKQSVANKVTTALTELGLSTNLVMPTKSNVERVESLQNVLVQLFDLKKAVDRCEGELRTLKKRREIQLEGNEEIKIEETDTRRGTREASVKSARTKRSASVSSADVTVTKKARKE